MNEGKYREYGGYSCYFHPKEVVVGVCHLCLNERLLILAHKQGVKSSKLYDYYNSNNKKSSNSFDNSSNNHHLHKPKPYVTLPKIFAIASFFSTRDNIRNRSRGRPRHRDSNHHDYFDDADATSTSSEDESFISIKFGDNGVASWDKTSSTMSKVSLQHCSLSWGGQTTVKDASNTTNNTKGSGSNFDNKSVVEHAKSRPASPRWRKRIGWLFQVIRWKKTNKAGGHKVVEGVKVVRNNNKSWTRTLNIRTKV